MQNSKDTYRYKVGVTIQCFIFISSLTVSVIEIFDQNNQPLDLVAPPLATFIHFACLISLIRNPKKLVPIFWTCVLFDLALVAVTHWYFLIRSITSSHIQLVEVLPPITSFLLVLLLSMPVFATPFQTLITMLSSWIIIALPLLIYLVLHPDELLSPRGMDMFVTLGPATLLTLAIVELNKGIAQKIISLNSERSHMQSLAELDPLTKLYNRRGIESVFPTIHSGQKDNIGLILFDIDHFKQINDQYGHDVGDIVLSQVAQRCKAVLRKGDLLARWGGEEFLVLIQDVQEKELHNIAESLRLIIANQPIHSIESVTASFGITKLRSTDSKASLLKRVDQAMYEAKHQGRNRIVMK